MPGFACARAMPCHDPSASGGRCGGSGRYRFDRWNTPVGTLYSEIHMVPPVCRLVFMDPKGEEQGTAAVGTGNEFEGGASCRTSWCRIKLKVPGYIYNSHLATHFAVDVLTDLEFSVRNCRMAYRSHGNRVFQQNMFKYRI